MLHIPSFSHMERQCDWTAISVSAHLQALLKRSNRYSFLACAARLSRTPVAFRVLRIPLLFMITASFMTDCLASKPS